MTKDEALKILEAAGSAQTRKTYARHGIGPNMFGVSYAVLGKLEKQIKCNHPLACQLWATGNHDARVLATMIADPAQADEALLDRWVRDLDNSAIVGAFASLAARTPLARAKAAAWANAAVERISGAGWIILSFLANEDASLPDTFFEPWLETIRRDIHSRKNRVRHAMNNALIAFGVRNPALEKKALAVAKAIGKVEVDHGDTSCQTPDAAAYIKKTLAHRREKAAKAQAKK